MTELEKELLQLVKDLRAENQSLIQILLSKEGHLHEEQSVNLQEPMKSIGREPWHLKQARLEKMFSYAAAQKRTNEQTNEQMSEKEEIQN